LYYGKIFSGCVKFGKITLEKFKDNYDIIFYIVESYYILSDFEQMNMRNTMMNCLLKSLATASWNTL